MKKVGLFTVKGGAGKTTIAIALARAFQERGFKVGLLDADVVKPDISEAIGVGEAFSQIEVDDEFIHPFQWKGIEVFSLGFYPEPERATMLKDKTAGDVVEELFRSVKWTCDVLLVDMPPQSHDFSRSLIRQFGHGDGFVVISTPQRVPMLDAGRTIDLLTLEKKRVIGLVVNMVPKPCPKCGYRPSSGRSRSWTFQELDVPVLGEVPYVEDGEEVNVSTIADSVLDALTLRGRLRAFLSG